MPRAAACLATLLLAGCASQAARLEPVSLKDSPAKPEVAAAVVLQPAPSNAVRILADGGEGLTKIDLVLAMGKALRARGFKIVEENPAWTVSASVGFSKITWSIVDARGTPHGIVDQVIPKPGEIRGADAVAAARSAADSVAKIIPSPKGEPL